MSSFYKKGDFDVICDVCGFKYKASQIRERWDGLMCCPQDWNPRQPQDFAHGIPEDPSTPYSRARPPDTYLLYWPIMWWEDGDTPPTPAHAGWEDGYWGT